jgi:hypothetical protein
MATLEENNVIDGKQRGVGFIYADSTGEIVGTKYRKYLGGGADRGFSWQIGSKPCLFGLWRLEKDFANDGRVILCEGETDALTLWQHGYTALALPGANMWKDEWAKLIPDGAKVYVIIEPDQGGRTVEADIEKSPLRDRAWFVRMPDATKDPNALHLSSDAGFVDDFDALIAGAEPVVTQKPPRIVLRHIADIVAEHREPEWLIDDTIEENVSALMVGRRGSLKSFIAIDWFMRMALDAKGVVILSAEGAGLGRRIEAWHNTFAPAVDLRSLNLLAMEKSISLRQADVLNELRESIGGLPFTPKAILLDTFSKYSAGIDENDNSEVAEFLESLVVSIKQEFGCTILIVAHTGHSASDRARGASSLGANTEAEYIVERPQGPELRCSVSRDRFKDSPSMPPLGYAGEVIDLGRIDKRGKPVTSIILRSGDIQPAKVRAGGANQTAAMIALREWAASHPGKEVVPHDELAALLKRQGITSKRKPEVLNWLVNAGALLPSVGGHKINSGAL